MVVCKKSFLAIFFIAIQATNSPAKACFDDKKLADALQSETTSLLYVWSPRMVLSATQAHLAADAAKAEGLAFVPLVDGRMPAAEWQSALRTLAATQPLDAAALAATQVLCSAKLLEKDAYAHFPTAFVAKSGDMHPNRLVGAMPVQFWRQGIRERLKGQQVDRPQNNATALVTNVVAADVVVAAVESQAAQQCIPQNQFIALDPALAGLNDEDQVALGAYERISPDGRYILRSYSGKKLSAVSLVELPGPSGLSAVKGQVSRQRILSTPFSNEAFPVQGSWRYLVDTNGDHYTFNSILGNKRAEKAVFSGGMDGFYAAASEVSAVDGSYPLRDAQPVLIRSLSWPNANASGSATENRQGEGMLTSRTLTVDTTKHRVMADSARVNLCLNRLAQDGTMYALPMISVDGKEFAALPQNPVSGVPTMRIFEFGSDGKQCIPSGQFTLQSGKVIFGFSSKAKKHADVAYEYRGQVWWVRRDDGLKSLLPLNLAPWEDPAFKASQAKPAYQDVTASAFPGFTRDGRIIYAANWKRCDGATQRDCTQEGGYVVSDPFQSNAYRNDLLQTQAKPVKSCITVQDVANERAAFSAFHGTD
jgi:hypothetical protein